jgi:serine/threonine-protein kinase
VFGRYDVPALHISLAVAITASVEFTRSYFDLRARVRWLWPACAAVSAVTLLLPDPHTGNLVTAPILVAYLAGCLGYEIVLSAREARRRAGERRARYILASWIGMAVLGVPDFAYWCGLGDLTGGARVGSLGIAMIAFWLSMVLSAEHVATLRQRAALAAELSARVVELEAQGRENAQLNRELQRQIAERSGQLADALARIARLRPDEPEALAPGAVVHDRYRVIRPIGAGGMGAVYEVERVTDGRRLALKVARRAHGEAVARLAREAQLAATVRHPHLVSVVDVDVASSGLLFLVMELVDGDSLRQLAPHHGEPSWAIPVLAQLADGLAALHASGVIHRDLKPSNVLVTTAADGDLAVKIVDFGIARQVDHDAGGDDGDDGDPLVDAPGAPPARGDVVEAEPEPPTATAMGLPPDVASPPPRPRADRLTRTGYVPGTPAYIAPELARGDAAVTTAADVYALGVIAFELLTGAPPFARPQVRLAARRERLDPLPTVDARWRDAPPALVVALRACLHPEPAGRPTAAAIATLLREARAQGAA